MDGAVVCSAQPSRDGGLRHCPLFRQHRLRLYQRDGQGGVRGPCQFPGAFCKRRLPAGGEKYPALYLRGRTPFGDSGPSSGDCPGGFPVFLSAVGHFDPYGPAHRRRFAGMAGGFGGKRAAEPADSALRRDNRRLFHRRLCPGNPGLLFPGEKCGVHGGDLCRGGVVFAQRVRRSLRPGFRL